MLLLRGKYLGFTEKVDQEKNSKYRVLDVLEAGKNGYDVKKVKCTDPKVEFKKDQDIEIEILPFVYKTDSGAVGLSLRMA